MENRGRKQKRRLEAENGVPPFRIPRPATGGKTRREGENAEGNRGDARPRDGGSPTTGSKERRDGRPAPRRGTEAKRRVRGSLKRRARGETAGRSAATESRPVRIPGTRGAKQPEGCAAAGSMKEGAGERSRARGQDAAADDNGEQRRRARQKAGLPSCAAKNGWPEPGVPPQRTVSTIGSSDPYRLDKRWSSGENSALSKMKILPFPLRERRVSSK